MYMASITPANHIKNLISPATRGSLTSLDICSPKFEKSAIICFAGSLESWIYCCVTSACIFLKSYGIPATSLVCSAPAKINKKRKNPPTPRIPVPNHFCHVSRLSKKSPTLSIISCIISLVLLVKHQYPLRFKFFFFLIF